MKGVKRRFANVRNIAIFISIFMFISLFSNITVKADELEDGCRRRMHPTKMKHKKSSSTVR